MSPIDDAAPPDRTETRGTTRREGQGQGGPWLFKVFQCERPLGAVARYDLSALSGVDIGRGEDGATVSDDATRLRVQVLDRWMSSRHARVERSLASWVLHDDGAKNPTLLRGAPVRRAVLADGDLFEVGGTFFLFRASMHEGAVGARALAPTHPGLDATLVPALEGELSRLDVIARGPLPVLLRGEAGVGKAHVARAIHARSGRAGPLVAAHAALDDDVVRRAHRGTLYLDALRDLAPDAQAALLRALRGQETGAPDAPDVRVVCAAHDEPLDAVRADLVARLSVYPVTLPPLRERREDLGLLVGALLPRVAGDRAMRFEPAAVRALFAAAWPSNARGLEGALAAAAALAHDGVITLEHLPETLRAPAPAQPAAPAPTADAALSLRLEGEYWSVTWRDVVLRQRDSVGLRYLAHLVERPGVEVHVSELVRVARRAPADEGADAPGAGDDAGPMLDDAAKAAYRRRIEDLRETIDEATGWGDRERAAKAQAELDALSRELARAVGLGGRDRKASATAERMRVGVTLRIRDALKRIDEGSAALGRHLAASVRTGAFCAYDPGP